MKKTVVPTKASPLSMGNQNWSFRLVFINRFKENIKKGKVKGLKRKNKQTSKE